MERRAFLNLRQELTAAPLATKSTARRTATGLSKYSGSWTKAEVKHLLARTLFGYKVSEINAFLSKGLDQAVADLLAVASSPPDPPVNNYSLSDVDVAFGSTWVGAAYSQDYNQVRTQSFKSWWMGQIINQAPTILEKMTLFWHNHFSTQTETVFDSRSIYTHHAMLRANAVGNFKNLVKLVTLDSAMLIYLNGYLNTKQAPDENYARELQELFCVGKGPGSQYTEDDVKAAARVLTGWRVNRGANPVSVFFDSTRHDTNDKVFSSFYGNTKITGRTGSSAGEQELDDLLTMIFSSDEVAKFICRKLYRFFVYYDIDAGTESDIIEPLADLFRNSNYDIKPVLQKLLLSEHFFDMANRGCYIKPPIEMVAGFARQTELAFPGNSFGANVLYDHWFLFQYYAAIIGENLADPPNVAGWPAWYQEPVFYENWINSDSLPKRNQFSDYYLAVGYNKSGFLSKVDLLAFAGRFSKPEDPNQLVADALEFLLPMPASDDLKKAMKAVLLPGGIPDYNWKDAWNLWVSDPSNTVNKKNLENLLLLMFKAIMNLSEYQLS